LRGIRRLEQLFASGDIIVERNKALVDAVRTPQRYLIRHAIIQSCLIADRCPSKILLVSETNKSSYREISMQK
jgi:hypothetical protein